MSDILTDADLAAITKRAEAATPGPLTVDAMYGSAWYTLLAPTIGQIADVFAFSDAHFFAYARTDIPTLLATVAALRERVAALEDERNLWRGHMHAHRARAERFRLALIELRVGADQRSQSYTDMLTIINAALAGQPTGEGEMR